MKTLGSRSRVVSRGASSTASRVRRQTAAFSQTETRLAAIASASVPSATAASVSAAWPARPAKRRPGMTRPAPPPAQPQAAGCAVWAAYDGERGDIATPAPPAASRKKWFAVATIENTTSAG